MLIWADGNNIVLIDYHTNFNLSSNGEEIGLFDSNEVLIDKIVYENQTTDISFGRQPDGGSDWYFFDVPTPGKSNNTSIFCKNKTSPIFSIPRDFIPKVNYWKFQRTIRKLPSATRWMEMNQQTIRRSIQTPISITIPER